MFRRKNILLFILSFFTFALTAQTYKQLCEQFEATENNSDAFAVGQKMLKKYPKELSKDPMQLAAINNISGNYYFAASNYDSSQACFARAVNLVYSVKADTSFQYAFYLANMAFVLKEMGYYETSDKYYQVALPRLAGFLGASSPEYSGYCKQFVDLKVDVEDYATANAYNEALLYYYKVTKGESDEMYLACLTNKARIMQGQGKYRAAIPLFMQLVFDTKLNFPADTLTQTITLNNLAYCYRLAGENAEAEKYFIEAYRMQNACKSISPAQKASLLNNLAIVYKAKCDYANAEKCFLKSIELYKEANMQQTVEFANPCNNLGDMYRILGNTRDAYTYLSYALEIRRNTSGEEHEYYANALNNIGLLYFEAGMLEDAETIFVRCEEIYKARLGENNDRYAAILNQLASLYAAKKEYSKALEYKNKCLRLVETTVGKQNDRYGLFLSGKGLIESNMKEYKKAVATYSEAANIFQQNFGNDNYNYIDMLHSLAVVNDKAGNYKEARSAHLKSIYGYKKIVAENLSFMSDEEKTSFYFLNSGRYETFENFVVRRFRNEKNVKDDSLLKAFIDERLWSKSILLNESESLYRNIRNSKDTAVKNLFEKWFDQKKSLHQLYQFSKQELAENNVDLDNEQSYLNALEKELTKSVSGFSEASEYLNFDGLKKALGKTELAIEIIRNEIYENDSVSEVTYSALVIGKDYKAPVLVVLDSATFFDNQFVEKYLLNIHSKTTDRLSYSRFFKPFEQYMKGITKLYFSPDGVYQKINLYTLFNPVTNKYLIQTAEIAQLTSLNELKKSDEAINENLSAALFGYPDYEWKPEKEKKPEEQLIASRFGFTDLPELPGTKKETELIADVFKSKGWKTNLYLSKEATEEQVKAIVNPTVLHIATHGFFLPNLDYSDEKILGFETEVAKQNPLLRSGVIMAGAASKDTLIERKDDGMLTAYEASLLNLQGTELVTLSACETGLGDQLMNGQGVYGLQRAFLTAGAKSVLMSLWVVDDYATQELMSGFYTNWLSDYESQTKRSSFRQAQLEVMKRYPAPYYWGAFVMIGK